MPASCELDERSRPQTRQVSLGQIEHQTSSTHSQNRHLYALYCLYQRQLSGNLDPLPDDPIPSTTTTKAAALPSIFADPGWNLLGTSILLTANCGNPVLQLFGFGPVAADGYVIGYIIKENGISM